MARKLIEIKNNIIVEVEAEKSTGTTAVSASTAKKFLSKGIDQIKPILKEVSNTIEETFDELDKQNPNLDVHQAEIDLGFNFEGEGTIYLAKVKANSSLNVKLIVRKKT